MLQNTLLIGSHSLSYAYDSLYGAYLKSHYPLEYYTVALNFYQSDFERTTKLTNELNYFDIKLSDPNFNHSAGDYSCDKKTNTIYKGTSSIKGLFKATGGLLYSLKDNKYNGSFLNLLIDCKKNSISFSDIITLSKLNYFSEFGKAKKLLKFIDLFDKFYGKKIIRKDREYDIKLEYLKQFCEKETDKQYSGFDSYKCLQGLWSKIKDEDLPLKEKMLYQLQYFNYIDLKDENYDKNSWLVTSLENRGKNKIVELYKICNGVSENVKVRGKIFSQNSFDIGSILKIKSIDKEGRWLLNKDTGEWTRSSTDFENILNVYSVEREEK